MHELAIVEGIIDAVIPAAREHNAEKILSIRLKIGELSGVIPSCIQEYFTIAARDTIAEGAKILIERVPIRINCADCGYDGELKLRQYRCPACQGTDFRIVSGREYFVDSIEAE